MATDQENLIAKIRKQMIVIGILILLLIAVLFYVFLHSTQVRTASKSVKFLTEVDDETADKGVDNFGGTVNNTDIETCRGEFFDSTIIAEYLKTKYPAIIARHTAHQKNEGVDPLPDYLKWKIGFYWSVRDSLGKPRMSIYVLPVLYDANNKKVLDYFKATNNKYYDHPGTADPKNIYDEGNLWP